MTTEVYLGYPPQYIVDWIKTHSQPAQSPYFAYDENRVITGLHQGSPNIQEEGGWTYGGSNVVENYATAIGNNAFNDVDYAMTKIPPSKAITGNIAFQNITSIGDSAFSFCIGLTNVMIGNSVTSIGYDAFSNCSGLTNITIPDGMTTIMGSAFYNCSGLTSVTIPDSVTSIGEYAFCNCTNLTNVTIESGIQGIGGNAF